MAGSRHGNEQPNVPLAISRRRRRRRVSAVRQFRREEEGFDLTLLVYDSESDAEGPIGNFRTEYVRNPKVRSVAEREIRDVVVPGTDRPYLWEREKSAEIATSSRYIAGRVNNVAMPIGGPAGG